MNMALTETAVQDRSWSAKLDLLLERSKEATRLSRCRHSGPLYVQKPFYPEGRDLAHLYLLHPPGGIVSGDYLDISVNVQEEAAALITTPGAARIYRAREQQPLQRQKVHLTAGRGASLEWFPLETIVFNGACVELSTTIDLSDDSAFVGWELTCFGLPASDELFERGSFQQHYQIRCNGLPLFVDRMVVTDNRSSMLKSKASMQGNTVSGFFIIGPFSEGTDSVMEDLRKDLKLHNNEELAAVSRVGSFIIGRYLGASAEQGRSIFVRWWQQLRPLLLNRPACSPRIWAT
jgi:urease accessory protein